MFSGDFKEKATGSYVLKDVKIGDFQRFLDVLNNKDVHVDTRESLERLFQLADMWFCDTVLGFCHDVLARDEILCREFLTQESIPLTLKIKIRLCDRHGFHTILATFLRNVELEELRQYVRQGQHWEPELDEPELSVDTLQVIITRLAN
uniref:BTB domain-containing protein n=1 Tax=Steinernema glaseri TaxID=37863 RepID=A0A1I8ABS2_9BILA